MFCGIVEEAGKIMSLVKDKTNLHITVSCSFVPQLKIDQSIAHNGVCLTVINKTKTSYTVTAIKETLQKTNLSKLKKGEVINLERCMKLGDRIDGHIVQGHIDCTASCTSVVKEKGSWVFSFAYAGNCKDAVYLIVEKGSVTVNGVSLTVVGCHNKGFSVAIIPYTFNHTNFHSLKKGDHVNLEFDIIGKYVVNLLK